jgi:hypothetical protein
LTAKSAKHQKVLIKLRGIVTHATIESYGIAGYVGIKNGTISKKNAKTQIVVLIINQK